MISSVAESTLKQYDTSLRLWWNFCTKKNIPLFQATNRDVLTFLQKSADEHKYKYGTLNSHRSALSLILPFNLGTDPTIKRFMKGMSRLRPAKPRYANTWDPLKLLLYIEGLPINNLTLLQLSQKLVTLLALITGGRLQTLSLIRLSNLTENQQAIQINISDPNKTSGVNREQPTLHIPFYKEKPTLCVAMTLKKYIEVTEPLRKQYQDLIFLTVKKPHAVPNKQTLSRWVKQMLHSAGIDTATFKPHSTRHASTSAARRLGVPLETICRTAGWSKDTAIFANFYYRHLSDKTVFAKAVLGLHLATD